MSGQQQQQSQIGTMAPKKVVDNSLMGKVMRNNTTFGAPAPITKKNVMPKKTMTPIVKKSVMPKTKSVKVARTPSKVSVTKSVRKTMGY